MPRRAAWWCGPKASRTRKPDTEERVWGPAKSAPPAGRRRLCEKAGRGAGSARNRSPTAKRKNTAIVRKTAGRATVEILAEALPQLVLKTPFPKTMYWTGKGGARFIRPIRWIVALLDNQSHPV